MDFITLIILLKPNKFDFGDKPKFKVPTIPCTSQQHIDPKPYTSYLHNNNNNNNNNNRKGTSFTAAVADDMSATATVRRKSSADVSEYRNFNNKNKNDGNSNTSGGSSRYIINNPVFVRDVKDKGDVCNAGALVVSEPVWLDYDDESPKKSLSRRSRDGDSPALVKSRSSSLRREVVTETAVVESPRLKSSRSRSRDQVVELRVSIHCKGCAGKVRKHLSRMEGVTSFHIDLESKKVTVVGNVTPSIVLSSISKVKNAQLWPSPSPSSSTSPYITIGY